MNEIAEKVDALLAEAEEENKWGGSENGDGMLEPGEVDWDALRAKVRAVIEGGAQ